MNLEHSFKNPQNEYRGVPFWSWNDKLEQNELIRQIDEMVQAGMGGFIIHSRTGLLTEYMSDEWMDLTKACVARAKELGLLAWLYDEDRWPSGFAGGDVPAMKPANRMKLIIWSPADAPEPGDEGGLLAYYSAVRDQDGALTDWQLEPGGSAKPGRELIRFDWHYQPKSDWCNGESYLDTISESAVQDFIHHTYDAYAREIGADLGDTVKGVFTDEPQYYMSNPEMGNTFRGVPYTEAMSALFERTFGYHLVDALPALLFPTQGGEHHRYNYRLCVTQMFVDHFTKQIGQWCERHHCDMTGHFMAEDSFSSQIFAIGAAMPHYEYMQSPGIDLICRRQSDPLLPRQTSSGAHQFGRRRILSESFGGSGWNLSFVEQKWIADWLFVHGVTYMNQHLSYYSLWGGRKRDWPPSFFYQQPWWKHYSFMSDYMARVNLIAQSGEVSNDLLLIHTIGSGWATWTPDDMAACDGYGQQMVQISEWLGQMQRDHDYGDEMLMARHGKVQDGLFQINLASYKLVILPPALTLADSTVELLRQWMDAGGKLICAGEKPVMVNGIASDLSTLWSHTNCISIDNSREALQHAVDGALPVRVSATQNGVNCPVILARQTALDDGRMATYLVNRSLTEAPGDVLITLAGEGSLGLWNLQSGEIEPVAYTHQDGYSQLTLPFGIVQSYMLVIDLKATSAPAEAPAATQALMVLNDAPKIELTQPNALPLDFATLIIPGVTSVGPKPVLFCTEDVARHLDISTDLNNGGISLWKLAKDRKRPVKELDIELVYRFDSEIDLSEMPITMLVEKPDQSEFEINGRPVIKVEEGWWMDIGLRKLNITGSLKKGSNTIIQKMHFVEGTTLEPLILLGHFGVELRHDNSQAVIVPAPTELSLQDWTSQGLPFYCGSVKYTWEVSLDKPCCGKLLLKLGAYEAPLAIASINGQPAGELPWAPYELDITDRLVSGQNSICVELFNSPRNLMGPLHNRAGEIYAAAPQAFCSHEDWVDRYMLVPHGLITAPSLLVRK